MHEDRSEGNFFHGCLQSADCICQHCGHPIRYKLEKITFPFLSECGISLDWEHTIDSRGPQGRSRAVVHPPQKLKYIIFFVSKLFNTSKNIANFVS